MRQEREESSPCVVHAYYGCIVCVCVDYCVLLNVSVCCACLTTCVLLKLYRNTVSSCVNAPRLLCLLHLQGRKRLVPWPKLPDLFGVAGVRGRKLHRQSITIRNAARYVSKEATRHTRIDP